MADIKIKAIYENNVLKPLGDLFDKKFKKLVKKDGLLEERVIRKLQAISINPEIGEPKRHALN